MPNDGAHLERIVAQPARRALPAAGPGAVVQRGGVNVEGTVFGLTEAQISDIGLTYGVGGFIALMLFIIWKVARESKAGKFGSFVLFFVLAFGIFGFLMKHVIQWLLKL